MVGLANAGRPSSTMSVPSAADSTSVRYFSCDSRSSSSALARRRSMRMLWEVTKSRRRAQRTLMPMETRTNRAAMAWISRWTSSR